MPAMQNGKDRKMVESVKVFAGFMSILGDILITLLLAMGVFWGLEAAFRKVIALIKKG